MRVIGEIKDPLDKAAIDAELVGIGTSKQVVAEMNGYLGNADFILIDIIFDVESEGLTFWNWLKTHRISGDRPIHRHSCGSDALCVLDEEVA